MFCDFCATASCPTCKNCTPACVPAEGRCDDHDDCEPDFVCLYGTDTCAPGCGSAACLDPNTYCERCATSSCPCCEDCVGVCQTTL
jgi:hypothetical protein